MFSFSRKHLQSEWWKWERNINILIKSCIFWFYSKCLSNFWLYYSSWSCMPKIKYSKEDSHKNHEYKAQAITQNNPQVKQIYFFSCHNIHYFRIFVTFLICLWKVLWHCFQKAHRPYNTISGLRNCHDCYVSPFLTLVLIAVTDASKFVEAFN